MKKTGLLMLLMVATLAVAQQSTTQHARRVRDRDTSVNVPFVRYQTPTAPTLIARASQQGSRS